MAAMNKGMKKRSPPTFVDKKHKKGGMKSDKGPSGKAKVSKNKREE